MKIVVLTSGTNNTLPLYEPLKTLGHDLLIIVYDEMDHDGHVNLPIMVERVDPAWVLYIGAIEGHHGKPIPNVDVLAEIGARYKLVHLCCDGAEPFWWEQLDRYYTEGRFALQVNIDGVRTGPIGDRGLTLLCPVDASTYQNKPWRKRKVLCGFSGGMHAGRVEMLKPLEERGLIKIRLRDGADSYEAYKTFLGDCMVGINVANTGGMLGGKHVKFRVSGELPAAGCLVLEERGSPLANWFTVDKDYLEYETVQEAINQLDWVRANAAEAATMAESMRARVVTENNPKVFWSRVMERIGLGIADVPAPDVVHQPWTHGTKAPVVHAAPTVIEKSRIVTTRPVHYNPDKPELLEIIGAINLVSYGKLVHAVPQRLGRVDVDKEAGVNPAIASFSDLAEARRAVHAGDVK